MYINVCVYILYMYIYLCVCIYIMYINVCVDMYIYLCVCIYIYMYIYCSKDVDTSRVYMTVVVLPSTGGSVAPPTPGGSASLGAGPSTPAYYLVKWITWKEKKTPIVTQSENGPCPLLAIMNTLFLRWKVGSS